MKTIILDGENLKIEDVISICQNNAKVIIPKTVIKKVEDNWKTIAQMLKEGQIMYGINTGIGGFGNVIISRKQAGELSTRMLRAHASGYGNPVELEIAKATLLLRINVLAKGYSGIRPILLKTMIKMLNKNVIPVFYEKGSVGTSGDLAPLSQMGLVIIGEGKAYWRGKIISGADAMKRAKIKPLSLAHREGLAIMNGSQFMTAIAAFNIYNTEKLIKQAEISGSMTVDVLNCVEKAYDARYHAVRPFKGQNESAENIRRIIEGSEILKQPKEKTQDSYSLRSIPQVCGACRDALDFAKKITEIEMNSVADNPIFFTKDKICLTGSNFHGCPIGYTQDLLGIVITDLGNLCERQTNNLLDPACSKGLPAFLVESAGLDSGLMISQYTQAALVSENKILASPASVDSIPVSGNQEDHVSFGTIAARKCREIIKNTEAVVAIQLLAACQAYEFKKPLKPSKAFQVVYGLIRSLSPKITEDRAFYKDIENLVPLVRNHQILKVVETAIGKLK